MSPLVEFAPAKLNLYLHVTGRRADGYHDLDSLAVFIDVGDKICIEPKRGFHFTIEGPYAESLEKEPQSDNLAVKAAEALAKLTGNKLDVGILLVKNLPIASGIGGGSSDAAAVLRGLAKYWGLEASDPRLVEAARPLGQDVTVCLTIENTYITANGTSRAPRLPHIHFVLLNPNKTLATPLVYKAFRDGNFTFSPKANFSESPRDSDELIKLLTTRSNDLYASAIILLPEIGTLIQALELSSNCIMARMSGSGATCFGIFDTQAHAELAADAIKQAYPGWWVKPAQLL